MGHLLVDPTAADMGQELTYRATPIYVFGAA